MNDKATERVSRAASVLTLTALAPWLASYIGWPTSLAIAIWIFFAFDDRIPQPTAEEATRA
ncbi:hypothetical protein ER308_07110 [Egibacter rhizosphaerae]|uniref:Uncharacterized protein n=1 Tax=Egibacter rhizosphaerae TaxID=1670831 RepID=A0A411YDQ0_9ACTN|nr:hypothetical protein [Egibacter rhizosphaerae]QBI19335.1 hypothetical protein ER308_07110 [Egibacter rhizosphaerae]